MSDFTFNQEDYERGDKIVTYALRVFTWGTALAVAFSCSSFIIGLIMAIITAIFCWLIGIVIDMLLMAKGVDKVESLGRFVGQTTGRVSAMFARKEPAHA